MLVGATALLQLAVFLLDAATLAVVLAAIGSDNSDLATLPLVGVRLEAALTATLLLRGLTFWLPMPPGLWIARRELRQSDAARPPMEGHEARSR
jgi:hypothetical protein